ncbi:hypothetical protein N7466_006724 [Penicillium verhagenii]|uniref:uncharacterized protein n=1 Tax=Penicillium verhagenii TaxID=1562060 RepID=UPI00254517C6|nr:uncharacterized protein N7466_006724 [Penicillium verhagenii]KAJ5927768.1 hypothetical protein N7466_006724 [Penicillium verhagenii]
MQVATAGETIETKSQGAHDDETMIVKHSTSEATDEDLLAAAQGMEGHEIFMIGATVNAENDQRAPQMSAAENAAIAAIDTVKTGIKMEKCRLEDIAVPVLDHAPHEDRAAPSVHYNEADLYLHNPMHLPANGRLAAETNTVQVEGGEGIVLKYHEPPEARKPPAKEPWRMYVFKGDDLLEMVELNERSCWLIGRERAVVDFPLDHPSCSKQHAALQFRYVEKRNEYGDRIGKVKPYLLDLESSNGSTVNKEPIPAGRYVEVMDKDVMGFGTSTREYVLMLPK